MENKNVSHKIISYNLYPKKRMIAPITLINHIIPKATSSRYLGLIQKQRLTWADYIKSKLILLNAKRKSLLY